ncbi:uncharacterized protein YcsI (UPF0317 family) [Crossiella equi]|uniref:Uncharacterized protein YcsI (UPF0317 family) n=1 Tax=Crossiella equi TaxID=130796 RepID=A0ABS5A3M8_9PSEU|nr:hypothetical protein [Crossiella equi]MBP2471183.1 uncharacterized protein YcsI (UPF0317 family) [Crossiella equi]
MNTTMRRAACAALTIGLSLGLSGVSDAATSKQDIICEYRVHRNGIEVYPESQFWADKETGFLVGNSIVWAHQHTVPNHKYGGEHVRELTGLGGGWVWAVLLTRTETWCQPQ